MIYFDNAATNKIMPCALEAMNKTWENWANPNALHKQGVANKIILEDLKKEFRNIFNIPEKYIVLFTSCSTESNALVLQNAKGGIYCTEFEHSSIKNFPNAQAINFEKLEEHLKKGPSLVSVALIQHETGMKLNYKKLSNLIKKYDAKLHIDASQAKEINIEELDADYITIASHKMGGPIGVAALVSKTLLKPLFFGGQQEYGIRPGTQAIPLISGFVSAAAENKKNNYFKNHFKSLKNKLYENLQSHCFFENVVDKEGLRKAYYDDFADHVICLLSNNGSEIVAFMDMNNIAIANSSACKSGQDGIGALAKLGNKGVRISFGWQNNLDEVMIFCKKWDIVLP